MAISGRVPLLLVLGLVPVVLRPVMSTMWLWLLLVLLLVLADWLLAPSAASLSFERRPVGSVRLGHPTDTLRGRDQHLAAPGACAAARRLAALGGSLGQPAPGPALARRPGCPAHRRCSRGGAATCAPSGSRCARAGRSGWRRSSARSTYRGRCGRCRRSSPASTCPRGWRGCASSTGARRCGCAGRARSSTRCASTSAATTSAPSTGAHRPAPATSSSAPGSPSATDGWCWCSTPRAPRPAASTTCRGSTPPWTRPCCWPLSRPGPATGSTSSPVTGGSGSRLRSAGARDIAARLQDTMADLEPVIAEADWDAIAGAVQGLGRQRALVVLLTPLEPSAVEEGLLTALPTLTRHHRVVLASVRDPALDRLAATRATIDEVYDAAAAEQVLRRRERTADLLTRLGVDVVDADAERLPPALADHYLHLKAQGSAARCGSRGASGELTRAVSASRRNRARPTAHPTQPALRPAWRPGPRAASRRCRRCGRGRRRCGRARTRRRRTPARR